MNLSHQDLDKELESHHLWLYVKPDAPYGFVVPSCVRKGE